VVNQETSITNFTQNNIDSQASQTGKRYSVTRQNKQEEVTANTNKKGTFQRKSGQLANTLPGAVEQTPNMYQLPYVPVNPYQTEMISPTDMNYYNYYPYFYPYVIPNYMYGYDPAIFYTQMYPNAPRPFQPHMRGGRGSRPAGRNPFMQNQNEVYTPSISQNTPQITPSTQTKLNYNGQTWQPKKGVTITDPENANKKDNELHDVKESKTTHSGNNNIVDVDKQ